MLKTMRHQFESVSNGREALDAFTAQQGPERFDVIVMDIEMPVMDGRQTVVAIREHERAHGSTPVPIVAVTAHTGDKERREYLKAGFNAVVTKPLRSEEISAVLQQLAAR